MGWLSVVSAAFAVLRLILEDARARAERGQARDAAMKEAADAALKTIEAASRARDDVESRMDRDGVRSGHDPRRRD